MLEFKRLTARPKDVAASLVIVGVFEERMLTSAAAELDAASGGALKRLMESGDVTGRLGTTALLHQLGGLSAPRVLVVGLGEQRKFDTPRFLRATRDAHKALKGLPVETVASYLPEVDVPKQDIAWKLTQSALAADYTAYKYTATLKARAERVELRELQFSAGSYSGDALERAAATAAGVRLARELGMPVATSWNLGIPALAVDTHIFRIGNRLKIAPGRTPDEVEENFLRIIQDWATTPPVWRLSCAAGGMKFQSGRPRVVQK